MNEWLQVLAEIIRREAAVVLITVIETDGSVPREPGTKMVVANAACIGTIGGGSLEFEAIEQAQAMLCRVDGSCAVFERFALGPRLRQCCGGVATLLFERLDSASSSWVDPLLAYRCQGTRAVVVTSFSADLNYTSEKLVVTAEHCSAALTVDAQRHAAIAQARTMLHNPPALPVMFDRSASLLFEIIDSPDFRIVVFGAGHVGKALVHVLSRLHCTIQWVDSRASAFPDELPSNVIVDITEQPADRADQVAAGSYVLIMTHSHPLDLAICERVLRRNDIAYCGLIGSATKRKKFVKRMRENGLDDSALTALTCPIGVSGITGKHPSEIAIAVAAELLQVRSNRPNRQAPASGSSDPIPVTS